MIDLSTTGHQPMGNEDERVQIVTTVSCTASSKKRFALDDKFTCSAHGPTRKCSPPVRNLQAGDGAT